MRVAWLADDGDYIGGAELTQAEFREAAPDGIVIVQVPPETLELASECDAACVFNCVSYPEATLRALTGRPVVRYWNDVAPHGSEKLTRWLLANSTNVFCSPLHWERFPWLNGNRPEYHLIPPPVDLGRFQEACKRHPERAGAVALGPWMNPGKAPHLALEWAQAKGVEITFGGGGPFAPQGSLAIAYEDVPELLAQHETFVHLPTALEPFGRTVAEAWAAGCKVVTNRLVGARWWIEEQPEALDTAAEDFWKLVAR